MLQFGLKTAIFTYTDGPIFLKLSQMDSWTTKKKQDSIKISIVWCKIRYFAQIVIFKTPHRPPLSDLVFSGGTVSFFGQFQ